MNLGNSHLLSHNFPSLIYLGHICVLQVPRRQETFLPGLQIYPTPYHFVVGSQHIPLNERLFFFPQFYPIVFEKTEVPEDTVDSPKSQTI